MVEELIFRKLSLLPFLVGSLILIIFLKWLINIKSKRRASLGVSSLALFKKKKSFWKRLPEVLFILAMIFLILTLLNPTLPLVKNKKDIKAKEIMIVLDLSDSMTDFWKGTDGVLKIDVEIKYVVKFIESRKNDAIGLIVYSENPYLTSPFNYRDHWSLCSLVKLFGADAVFSGNIIPHEGSTATGEALFLTNEYLQEYGQSRERIIILFTDGESNAGRNPEYAFQEIKKSEYKVFVLGIDYYQYPTAQDMAQQAEETNGGFFPIDTEEDFEKAVYSIDRLVGKNKMTVDEYIVDDPQYFYFGFIALVLFVLVLLLKNLHYFRDLL